MDTKYLSYIITIANEKNMTRAAEKLYTSQSSLSYYLSKLEGELGTPLFLREKNHLIITPAGELYEETAKKMIAMKEQLYRDIASISNKTNIVVAASSMWGTKAFLRIVPEFRKAFPDVTFELSESYLYYLKHDIDNGSIDFAFISVGSESEIDDSMDFLFKEKLYFIIPAKHPYATVNTSNVIRQSEILTYFKDDTFLLSKRGSATRTVVNQMLSSSPGTSSVNICEVNGLPLTGQMVSQNVGVSFFPESGKQLPEYQESIRIYDIEPAMYRYNLLQHKKDIVFNKIEKAFYEYALNYFKKEEQHD